MNGDTLKLFHDLIEGPEVAHANAPPDGRTSGRMVRRTTGDARGGRV